MPCKKKNYMHLFLKIIEYLNYYQNNIKLTLVQNKKLMMHI